MAVADYALAGARTPQTPIRVKNAVIGYGKPVLCQVGTSINVAPFTGFAKIVHGLSLIHI